MNRFFNCYNKMVRLVYTFTSSISGNRLNDYIELLERSYKHNIRFHPIILYTDKVTYPLVKNIIEEIKIVNTNSLVFMDDLKMQVLELLEDFDILADFDIFLQEQIKLDPAVDLLVDRREKLITNFDYRRIINHLEKENFKINNDKVNTLLNVGFLKIYNKELRSKIINNYFKLRNWYVDNSIKTTLVNKAYKTSVIALQYQLEILCFSHNYSVKELSKYYKYLHLVGDDKFKKTDFQTKYI